MRPSQNRSEARRVHVRTPSEEDLVQQSSQSRRAPTARPSKRQSSYTDDEHCSEKKTNEDKQQTRDRPEVVASTAAPAAAPAVTSIGAPAPATATTTATTVPGIQPYHNPAGSTAALGFNQVYLHGINAQSSFPTGLPFAFNNQPNLSYLQGGINQAGQPAPVFVANTANPTVANMPEQLGGYQNSVPVNPGATHYQPQTPDTSLGPMSHTYVPRFDAGGVVMVQPGLVRDRVSLVMIAKSNFFPLLTKTYRQSTRSTLRRSPWPWDRSPR